MPWSSLLYVGRQFRHSSTQSLQTIYFQTVNNFSSSAENARVVFSGNQRQSNLNEEERYQYMMLLHNLFGAIELIWEQHRRGLVNRDALDRVVTVACFYYNLPGGREFWEGKPHAREPVAAHTYAANADATHLKLASYVCVSTEEQADSFRIPSTQSPVGSRARDSNPRSRDPSTAGGAGARRRAVGVSIDPSVALAAESGSLPYGTVSQSWLNATCPAISPPLGWNRRT